MNNTIEYREFTVEIHQDESPEDPRNWDNLGTMVCFHKQYTLGDEHNFSVDSFHEYINQNGNDIAVILPIYMYDHSGIGISTSNTQYPFNCPWDSGQVGYIYVTKEKIRKEFIRNDSSVKRITKKIVDRARAVLQSEVETYNSFVSGEVYGYVVKDRTGEIIHSCWGFYPERSLLRGRDELEYMLDETREAIDYEINERMKKRAWKIKQWIINKVPLINRSFPEDLALC
jgi:hypothetical protein